MSALRIANGAGFLGDWIDAPRRLVDRAEVDYLTIEHLAELTMSILARQREKDANAGYAQDFLDILRSLIPALKQQPRLKIIANSGGMNPPACVRAAPKMLVEPALGNVTIGCVLGDDLLPRLGELEAAGCEFVNLDTNKPLEALLEESVAPRSPQSKVENPESKIVSVNAYLGARPIADALAADARIVI